MQYINEIFDYVVITLNTLKLLHYNYYKTLLIDYNLSYKIGSLHIFLKNGKLNMPKIMIEKVITLQHR